MSRPVAYPRLAHLVVRARDWEARCPRADLARDARRVRLLAESLGEDRVDDGVLAAVERELEDAQEPEAAPMRRCHLALVRARRRNRAAALPLCRRFEAWASLSGLYAAPRAEVEALARAAEAVPDARGPARALVAGYCAAMDFGRGCV